MRWAASKPSMICSTPKYAGDSTTIVSPAGGYVETHGSPWDYDRRVPILFYAPGRTGFEHPQPIETVDILPTLAATIGLAVPAAEIDGRCIDLDPGAGDSCGG